MIRSAPPRRKPVRSGIQRGPKRNWPKHQKHVRKRCCAVPGCACRKIQFAHARVGVEYAGTSIKPPDWFGLPLCEEHHAEQHQIGERSFAAKYGLDMVAIALDLARHSTDMEMRDEMKTWHRGSPEEDAVAMFEAERLAA